MNDKPLPPELALLLTSLQNQNEPSVPEGLLLLKAFVSIKDSSLRAAIVELVEKIAGAAQS